jgi:hypothetical protein
VTLRSSPRFRGLRAITRASPRDGLANQLVFPADALGGRAHDVRDVLPRDVLLLLLAAQNHHQKVAAPQAAAAAVRPSVPAVDPRFAGRRASELARRHPRRSLRVVRSAKASPRVPRAVAIASTEPEAPPAAPARNRLQTSGRKQTKLRRSEPHRPCARRLDARHRNPRHRKRGLRSRPDSHRAGQVDPRAPDPWSSRRRTFIFFGGAFDRSERGVPRDGAHRRATQT